MSMFHLCTVLATLSLTILLPNACIASNMNAIDACWRRNPQWRRNRQQLATCSVGFAGKMTNNGGKGVILYKVIDASDNAINPTPGTLRYGATMIEGNVWITFQRKMNIKLESALFISSFTTIDGRGADVQIQGVGCLLVYQVTNVIIHGLTIHHCKTQGPTKVMGPEGNVISLSRMDGDAIRLVSASKVWIDHNTLFECEDGLLDVTRGSTDITISNNRFKDQDKVMLLGHDDGYIADRNMKVTVVYNHFGPNCNQRMPRVRHGYAHVANNLYEGWGQYAIGGSMNPSIKSEANYFIATKTGNKEITWRNGIDKNNMPWKFYSVRDYFENGASFVQSGLGLAKPNYMADQKFTVLDAKIVKILTSSSGALKCPRGLTTC